MIRALIAAIALLGAAVAQSQTLETPNYVVEITCQSKEYEVGCSHVTYKGTNKKSGQSISLSGKQLMKLCADGVTPCHSLGYEFNSGNTRYVVTEGGELIVSKNNSIILDEKGVWKE
jgi:hemolysin activation/secretion protein